MDDRLRRYTDLPALAHLLKQKAITFLDPTSWDDKNDSHYMLVYGEKRQAAAVLAVCFTQTDETYHHWRVFAHGASGVCIRFRRAELVEAIRHSLKSSKPHAHFRSRDVKYLKLNQINKQPPTVRDLPFLKRYAFQHEREFRMICEVDEPIHHLDVAFPLSCIERIFLSPWMPKDLSNDVRELVRSIPECRSIEVVRSTLISNEDWRLYAHTAR